MGFESCHPAVNLIFFTAVIATAVLFRHPVFLAVGLIFAFAYSIKRNGKRALIFDLCLIPCVAAFALYYSSVHHFGVTIVRQNFIGNNMTLESLAFGLILGCCVAAVLMWMSCVYSVFTSDKVVYLFGRVSPRISLFLAIVLRMVPRIKGQAKRINTARQSIGRGVGQGNCLQRMKNGICIFSMLISWIIGALATASDSMRARGSSLRGRKAFSIYRFDGRDRLYVIAMFGCLILTAIAVMWGRTDMVYDPQILWQAPTALDIPLLIGYGLLCGMPLGLDCWMQLRFRPNMKSA